MSINTDARRGLGVRPGKLPQLKINVTDESSPNPEAGLSRSPRDTGDKSPSFRDFSLPVSRPRQGSTSPTAPRSPSLGVGELQARLRRATLRPKEAPVNREPPKGLYESQKLLSHVLDRLESRLVPPDTLERAALQAKATSNSDKEKRKSGTAVRQLGHAVVGAAQSGIQVGQAGIEAVRGISSAEAVGSEEHHAAEGEVDWDMEETYSLVVQLRDLLLLADRQGLHLLQVAEGQGGGEQRRSRRPPAGSLTDASPSRAQQGASAGPGPNISPRHRLLAILRGLVSADCHHRVSSFGPLCPPNALQAACLDIATYLCHATRGADKMDVIEIVVDGLYTLGERMSERVYGWLEGQVGRVLETAPGKVSGTTRDNRRQPSIPSFSFTPKNPSSSGQSRPSGILNPHDVALAQSDISIRRSSLVIRLLGALCETINLDDAPLTTIYRLHRLLTLILSSRPDASLDLLEIAAFSFPASQRTAMSILTTYYPHMTGHNIVSRRPPNISYRARLKKWETGQSKGLGEDETERHHYVHWRVSSKEPSARPPSTCSVCEGDIHGYCIKCTLCGDVQHLGCYRSSEGAFRYDVHDDGQTLSVVLVKFSRQLTPLGERLAEGTTRTDLPQAIRRAAGEHELHCVHLFSSIPCSSCYKPIWSSPSSVFACFGGCQAFVHADCVDSLNSPSHSACQARRTWPASYFQCTASELEQSLGDRTSDLCAGAYDLDNRTFDEVAILYGALWTRYQVLKAGLAGGSLVIASEEAVGSDPLDLRPALRSYEDYLSEQSSSASAAALDFAHVHDLRQPLGPGYLFSDDYLAYTTALVKSPSTTDPAGGEQLSYSSLPISAVRAVLKADLSVSSELASDLWLERLGTTGYVRPPAAASGAGNDREAWVHFDLPLLAESSPATEILVGCIAACLESLDLTMVEQGFLLLVKRAWPSLLCTPHALEQLGCAVVRWVISEEETLHRIVREYASRHRPLPGLRTVAGAAASRTSGPVQLYQEARNALLRHYVQPWLEALHTQDPELYADILYEECKAPAFTSNPSTDGSAEDGAAIANLALDRLVAMLDAAIAFSCLLELLTIWLEDLGVLADQDIVFKSLPRLISPHTSRPPGSTEYADIFSLAAETASVSAQGLTRACRWMRVLAFSSAEVPWELVQSLVHLCDQERGGMVEMARFDLAITIQANVAYLEPKAFVDLVGGMLVERVQGMKGEQERRIQAPQIWFVSALEREPKVPELIACDPYLDKLLSLLLRAYGVSNEHLASTSFGSDVAEAHQTSSATRGRRIANLPPRALPLDESVILGIARLIQLNAYPVPALLDFLWLVITQALAVSNADETVYAMAATLYNTIWPLLDLDISRRCRIRILLKLITVHSTPLEEIIRADLSSERRGVSIERLLSFTLEFGDDTVTSDSRNWRSAVAELILIFVQAISDYDHSDPSAMAIRNSLLPLHFQAWSLCFEESIVSGNDERRLSLLVRLRQLRLSFPAWPVVSWNSLDELLTETVISIKQVAPSKSSQNVFALLDSQFVRYHLVALGLDMLASGIDIPYAASQRLQQHVAALCELPWQQPDEGMVDIVLPALRDLLDSPAQITTSSSMDTGSRKKMVLVGSLVLPAVIDFGSVLADQSVLAQRCLLDILLIVFYKHNTAVVLHPALNALQNIAIFVERSDCADNRILALAIVQTALDHVRREDLVRVVPAVFLSLSTAMLDESKPGGSSVIAEQCATLLRRAVKMFGRAGLLLNVLRLDGADTSAEPGKSTTGRALLHLFPVAPLSSDSVTVSQATLLLLHDLPEVLKRGRQALEQVLAGLSRLLPVIRDVMTGDAVEAFGAFISRLGKHVAEWTASEFDPDHALRASASVFGVAKGDRSVPLLSQVGTFLHLTLARFDVTETALNELLEASAALCMRVKAEDIVQHVKADLAVSAVQGLAVTPTTILTLLNHIIKGDAASQPALTLMAAASGCLGLLIRQHPSLASSRPDPQLTRDILTRSATLLLLADQHRHGMLGRVLLPLAHQGPHHQLDVFSSLLLASIGSDVNIAHASLLDLYPVISRAVRGTLRQVADLLAIRDSEAAGRGAEMLSAVLVVVRLAFLAADEIEALDPFWSGIASEWTRVVSLSLDPLCVNMPLRTTTRSVFLDMTIFLGQMDSPLVHTLEAGVDMLVRHAEETGSGGGKVLRANAAVKGDDNTGVSAVGKATKEKLLKEVKVDMAATERLRSLRQSVV